MTHPPCADLAGREVVRNRHATRQLVFLLAGPAVAPVSSAAMSSSPYFSTTSQNLRSMLLGIHVVMPLAAAAAPNARSGRRRAASPNPRRLRGRRSRSGKVAASRAAQERPLRLNGRRRRSGRSWLKVKLRASCATKAAAAAWKVGAIGARGISARLRRVIISLSTPRVS